MIPVILFDQMETPTNVSARSRQRFVFGQLMTASISTFQLLQRYEVNVDDILTQVAHTINQEAKFVLSPDHDEYSRLDKKWIELIDAVELLIHAVDSHVDFEPYRRQLANFVILTSSTRYVLTVPT